jgi:hypothetical protein
MPLWASGVSQDTVKVLDEVLLNFLDREGHFDVIGASDIDAMLGLEKSRR